MGAGNCRIHKIPMSPLRSRSEVTYTKVVNCLGVFIGTQVIRHQTASSLVHGCDLLAKITNDAGRGDHRSRTAYTQFWTEYCSGLWLWLIVLPVAGCWLRVLRQVCQNWKNVKERQRDKTKERRGACVFVQWQCVLSHHFALCPCHFWLLASSVAGYRSVQVQLCYCMPTVDDLL